MQRPNLRADILAGITGAVAGAPQAMGFALIAGVSPLYGLYGAIVAVIVGGLTSGSTFMTIAPTNALSLLVFSTLSADGDPVIEKLFLLTFLVGVFQLAAGLFKLGSLTQFVSNAVMTGFITGAAALIILGQVFHLNDYEPHYEGPWLDGLTKTLPNFFDWLLNLPQSHPETLVMGITATAIIAFLHETRFKSVATLVAIFVTTLWVTLLGWDGVPMVRDMAPIGSSLPMPVIPAFEYTLELLPTALAMAILALVQSAGITRTVPEPDGSTADANRDFIAQGLANIVNGVFRGMPAGGSLSRTAVNISAGAKTRWANIFSGVFVALLLLLLGSVIERITLAALAGHLVVAAFSLLRPKRIRVVWRVSRSARLAMVATFISTLVLPLEYSIYIGVILSLTLYVYTSANNIQVVELELRDDNRYKAHPVSGILPSNDTIIYSIHGNMYFAAVHSLKSKLPDPEKSHNTIVIMRMHTNKYMGSTGIRFLQEFDRALKKHGGYLILCDLTQEVRQQLKRTGTDVDFGATHLYDATSVYFEATDRAYSDAKAEIASRNSTASEPGNRSE